ncbi:helix-turn-helix domain-containing protein [Streptomyces sp. SPB162]|uniref:ArsR/SmtB family transcription factor n=1 Tax=Streptomyces sp. SPB162 TaxID=2940560 RepID=UPI0024053710|nr:helix-turn-helix domain-containing protein [Streptomyces sp. SPB162]MDF9811086.1 DNA-binding transcriptional ArsR family regulator [Streptomyces sp. SPB162]
MLRIHFTTEDLQRISLIQHPDPLWEIVCSMCRLQDRGGEGTFGAWRRSSAAEMRRHGSAHRAASMLRTLVPLGPYFPDFLTPASSSPDLASSVDRVLSTPQRRITAELRILGAATPTTAPFPTDLAHAGTGALAALGWALVTYEKALIAPVWERLSATVGADIALRARALMGGGTEGLLKSLRPMAQWEPPVLRVRYPVDQDLHLEGRGLRLVPSYFCRREPVTLADPDLTPTLVYPVDRSTGPAQDLSTESLAVLLGRTRAVLLASVAGGSCRSTTQLAAATRVSVPTASQQLAVLRDTGLIVSRREGKHQLHSVTSLGLLLLEGGPGPGPGPRRADGPAGPLA